MTVLKGLWGKLSEEPSHGSGYVARRLPGIEHCVAYAAVERPGNTHSLLIDVSSASIPADLKLPKAAGFEATVQAITPGANGRSQIALAVRRLDQHSLFELLAEDVVSQLRSAASEAAAVRAVEHRLHRWQRFFAGDGPSGLGVTAQQGLWAELWIMREHLLQQGRDREVLGTWTGPYRSNHDYESTCVSLEVKSSKAGPPIHVQISNALQLQAIAGKPLLLAVVLLDAVPEGGETLAEMVDTIRSILDQDPVATEAFAERLLDSNYLDVHRASYTTVEFAHRETRVYSVAGGFPRIIEADLPSGVGDVRYSIELSSCERYRIADANLPDLLYASDN